MISGILAIVGRPNVGKSTIFNRIIGERKSIVEDIPGVTRDRIYGKAEWLTKEFRVIDTGGIQLADQPFRDEINMQVEIAIDEADVILFVVSGKDGITMDDEYIARLLQKSRKPIVLAVNKVDDFSQNDAIYEFYNLGLGDPIAVSAAHGIGTGDMLDEIVKAFPDKQQKEYEGMTRFCLIGRPNVGKSSLVNAILNQERVIVSDIEGTTRDAIDTPLKRNGREYILIDTAGLRRKSKIHEDLERYSIIRTVTAVERADVVVMVIDAAEGVAEQDAKIAGIAHERGKGVIIAVNKWDAVEKDDKTIYKMTEKIKQTLAYMPYAEFVFISAKTGQRLPKLLI